jgi:hypothetical protein
VRISKCTIYKIDKISGKRVRRGILEYLVRWRGYSPKFDLWVPASSLKKHLEGNICYVHEQFYVTLYSNALKDIYPSNTLAAFTVQLAQAVELHPFERWEVDVCEFT